MEKSKYRARIRPFCLFILAMISVLALTTPIQIPDAQAVSAHLAGSESTLAALFYSFYLIIAPSFFPEAFLVAGAYFLYKKELCHSAQDRRTQLSLLVFAVGISFCTLLGASFDHYGNLDFLIKTKFQVAWSALLLVGYVPFFYALLQTAVRGMERLASHAESGANPGRVLHFLLEEHPFWSAFAILLVCWFPYWIVYAPGNLSYDAGAQIGQYIGTYAHGPTGWSNHHPVVSSLLMGALFRLGQRLGSANAGLACITLFHNLLLASSLAYAVESTRRWGMSYRVRMGLLAFFALHPVFPFWAQMIAKDTHAAAVMLLFFVSYLELIRLEIRGEADGKRLLIPILLGIACSLLRGNFIYVVAVSLGLLVFLPQTRKKRALFLLSAVGCFLGFSLTSSACIRLLDASQGGIEEALSLPFQQTARYLRDHGDTITPEEHAVLQAVFDYEALPSAYDPTISDPVKSLYKHSDHGLARYFATWYSMGKKQPKTYLEAALAHTYGYYCPFATDRGLVFNNSTPSAEKLLRAATGYTFPFGAARDRLYVNISLCKKLPLVNLLFFLGNYTWLLLFLMLGLFLQRKHVFLLGFSPAILLVCTCLASPVSAFGRYYLPVLLMAPLLFAWGLYGARHCVDADDAVQV